MKETVKYSFSSHERKSDKKHLLCAIYETLKPKAIVSETYFPLEDRIFVECPSR